MGILYGIDTRASAEIAWLDEHFGQEPMFDLGGMALTSQAIGPKILWMRRHEPEVFTGARMFIGSSSYMVYRLTGEYVMDYHTASYYNPLFDLHNLRWDARFAEPIVDLEVTVPADKFGDITADLSTRRGHVTGMDSLPGGLQIIKAHVPLSEVMTYASQLKSMTAGQGSFTMEFAAYEPVPPNVQMQIVEKYKKSRAGIEEE